MERKLRQALFATAAAGTMAFGVGPANAVSIFSQLFINDLNLISDNSAEYLINANGSLSDSGDSTVDLGDRLRAIVDFDSVENLSAGGTNVFDNDFSGIADITVVQKIANAGGGFTFLFAPTVGFAAEMAGNANVPFTAAELAGTALVLFEDNGTPFERTDDGTGTRQNRIDALEALAIDGTFRWALGFDGDTDNIWVATSLSDDISVIGATPAPSSGGSGNAQLNFIQNTLFTDNVQVPGPFTGPGGDGLIDVNGTISLLGTGGATTPFDSFNDSNGTFIPVPEPATLGILGIGLLAMGAALGRRRRA